MNRKLPWIFWFRISIRQKWFSYWWKTRGANFMELQLWVFNISFGMPWKRIFIEQVGIDYIKKANNQNKIPTFSFQIGNYK